MLIHPNIDPVAISIGPLAVRWYGLMYLVGFAAGWWLGLRRIAKGLAPVTRQQFDDLLFMAVLGVILGGRLGYVLFYKPGYYLAHPLEIFAVWQGGMSFHGGLLGVILAMAFAARRHKLAFLRLMDFVAPLCPLGIAAGRLGNFINGELYGRVTDLPWGMVFRGAGDAPRHPSQLYEFALEGLALFALLWWFSARPRPRGQVSALFLIGYGMFRISHCGQKAQLGHLHRDRVVLGLVAEAACHAAAARFDRLDPQLRDQLQHPHHRGHGVERFLMAMAVQQRLFRQRREASREMARVELAGDEFLEQKRMACEDFAARKHGAEFVAEAEQARGLEPDDRRAALDPGRERLQRATRLCLGFLDQPGREERPPAAQGPAERQGLRCG